MKSPVSIARQNGWKHLMLFYLILFAGCGDKQTATIVQAPEFQCIDSYLFTIDGIVAEFREHHNRSLKWVYFNDPRYDYNNFDMDCECPEYVIDEDDIHYLTFSLAGEKELQIVIHKYWVHLTGHDLQPDRYAFDKDNQFDSPQIHVSLRDKKNGTLYKSVKGRLHLTHFQFNKCITGKIEVSLENIDGVEITVTGAFSANYTGKINAPLPSGNE
ncbi:hypothetical protein QQ020_28595 [Fulvivirgaceae bacterium BMA12]|uniref:Lipoprotein n=1 Tax=Agaribacillus aureus TaxID=3051825 RepID=A0ABT8LE69_9BACT|nr:hypothetical protein [Fulvivirgaceae bacterium BMA12]